MRKSRAQSTLEYATIITIVVGALTVMSTYVQRAIQANLKVIENQINGQPGNEVNCKLPIKQDSGGSTSTGASTGSTGQQNPFCEIIANQPQNEPAICQVGPFSSDVPPIEDSQSAPISAVPVENSNEPVPCQGVPYNAATGIPSEDMPLVPESDSESTQIQEQVNSNINVNEPIADPEEIYQGSSGVSFSQTNEPEIYQGGPWGPSVPPEIRISSDVPPIEDSQSAPISPVPVENSVDSDTDDTSPAGGSNNGGAQDPEDNGTTEQTAPARNPPQSPSGPMFSDPYSSIVVQ